MQISVNDIIAQALSFTPSDIHISVGVPPVCRVNGTLVQLSFPPRTPQENKEHLKELLTQEQFDLLKEKGEIDIAITPKNHPDVRMRLNAYRQRGSYCMAFRVFQNTIPNFKDLGLNPQVMENFCGLMHGLILVTGATGTGKTTTITSMIDWINRNRSCHIMTIEDPIEYFHKHNKSIIHQREIGVDTQSYSNGLRAVLRQDPDVIFIGEMRDLESISTALTAAETGHLVFSTLHTLSAAKTIDRIIDVFPPEQQQQIRAQLSMTLQGIVGQQLIPSLNLSERVLAAEVMVMTPAISNLIRENKVSQIQNNILTGAQHGMVTMDTSLINLAKQGKISYDNAKAYANSPKYVEKELSN